MKSMDIVISKILLIMIMKQTDCMSKKYKDSLKTFGLLS